MTGRNHASQRPKPDWSKYWLQFKDGKTPATTIVHPEFFSSLHSGAKVIDIGCGFGRISRQLADTVQCLVVGVDINAEEISYAKLGNENSKHPVDYQVMSAAHLSFKPNTFDDAFLLGVLGGVQKVLRSKILSEAARVLRPGGKIYIGEFAKKPESTEVDLQYLEDAKITGEEGSYVVRDVSGGILFIAYHFQQMQLRELLEKQGFVDIHVREEMITRKNLSNGTTGQRKHLAVWATKSLA